MGNPCPICRDRNLLVDFRVSLGENLGGLHWPSCFSFPSLFPSFFTPFSTLFSRFFTPFSSLQNVKLLDQFICPHSGVIFHPIHTGEGTPEGHLFVPELTFVSLAPVWVSLTPFSPQGSA